MNLRNVIMIYYHPSTLLKMPSSSDDNRVEISTNLATSDDFLNSEINNGTQVENIESLSIPQIKPGTLANDII